LNAAVRAIAADVTKRIAMPDGLLNKLSSDQVRSFLLLLVVVTASPLQDKAKDL
jgi:hypothetical protein